MVSRREGVCMKKGKCAKATIRCTLVTAKWKIFVGENWCENPQDVCPRKIGVGYEKCKDICQQVGHAEQVAVMLAGDEAKGSRAYLEGHTYACMDCQHALFGAGVKSLSVGIRPPDFYADEMGL